MHKDVELVSIKSKILKKLFKNKRSTGCLNFDLIKYNIEKIQMNNIIIGFMFLI